MRYMQAGIRKRGSDSKIPIIRRLETIEVKSA
jgi:hypothetical protein